MADFTLPVDFKAQARARANREPDISEDFVQRIKSVASLEDFVSRYGVTLKKSGSNMFGLCPFHNEKNGSFTVNPSKQFYHCFGCGVSGDVIDFVKMYEAVSFREAVKRVAESVGISMPTGNEARVDTSGMLSVLAKAQHFYAKQIEQAFEREGSAGAQAAAGYIDKRKFSDETRKLFGLGYGGQGSNPLQHVFGDYRSNPDILAAGLATVRDNGERRDLFQRRLTFPIRDTRGRVVGFGARAMDDSQPKYLNSPATALFDKSEMLYGLYEARSSILEEKLAIVVEGYTDVVSLHQNGVTTAVATLGTACSSKQLSRLFSITPTVIMAFDGDKAGLSAAWRAMTAALSINEDHHIVRFLMLPQGKDPDDVVKEGGKDAFMKSCRQAMTLSDFMFSRLNAELGEMDNSEAKTRFLLAVRTATQAMPSKSIMKAVLLADASRLCGFTPAPVAEPRYRANVIAARAVPARQSVWARLASAAAANPMEALAEREAILADLVLSNKEEEALSRQLLQISYDTPTPRTSVESDLLASRDVLRAAAKSIKRQRSEERSAELQRLLRNSFITQAEYLNLMLKK